MTTEITTPFKHITIIGLGLIGGSLAMASQERLPEATLSAVDTHSETLQYALKNNIVHHVHQDLPETFEENHLIIIATHLSTSREYLERLSERVKSNDIMVIDVGSCKRKIVELGRNLLPNQFLAAHPMAGREFSGIESATSLLFTGKAFICCPHDNTPETLIERFNHWTKSIGAIPKKLDPETHDKYMAYVSHLPQLYSTMLTNLINRHEPGRLLQYHGGGIDDQLRLAASPYSMWGEVFAENQDNIRAVTTEMSNMLEEMGNVLDQPELKNWFDCSNKLHQAFHQGFHQGYAQGLESLK